MSSTDVRLRMSAQRALWGAIGPNLVSFSGEVKDKTISLRFVVRDGTSEDEIEDYRVVGTEILSDYVDEDIDEQFIRVATEAEARTVQHLAQLFFQRKLDGAFD